MGVEDVAVAISNLSGWLYVVLWSISYYPQPLLNLRRRSTEGLSFDFVVLNVLGSACMYSCHELGFLWTSLTLEQTVNSAGLVFSSTVRQEYAARHPHSPEPTTRFNDFCYGLHSLIVCSVVLSQFWPSLWHWKHAANRQANCTTKVLLCGSLFGLLACSALAFFPSPGMWKMAQWHWLDVLYFLTYVKLVVTVFKYAPQAISNYRRKSTVGFTRAGVLLDFTGGVLSLVQLFIDSSLQADWSGLIGNPLKFFLANLSMLADVVYMGQHVMYGSAGHYEDVSRDATEREPLLH